MRCTYSRLKRQPTLLTLWLAALGMGAGSPAIAETTGTLGGMDYRLSGFMSLVYGGVLDGSLDRPLTKNPGIPCPCYVTDWSNGGIYSKKFSFEPNSRIGVQGTLSFNPQWSVTSQITSRGTVPKPEVQWAYVSYQGEEFELQVGRKRIPLYFYSDYQDVGIAYPWISPLPDLYGWDATNYNGASLRYRGSVGGASLVTSIFGGAEEVKDNQYHRFNNTQAVDTKWKNIVGADIELSRDWWTVRAVYLQSRNEDYYRESGVRDRNDMKAYGLAFNADFDDWFILSEVGENVRDYLDYDPVTKVSAPAYSVGVGARLGNWTPFLTVGQYREKTSDPSQWNVTRWKTYSLALRYDISPSAAFKAEVIVNDDDSVDFTGDATVFRVAYDLVF